MQKASRRTLKSLFTSQEPFTRYQGKECINFSSNDYLGLRNHPKIKQGAIDYIERYGVGVGSSRLVSGNYSYHEALEQKLASLMGYESALLFNSGFQANLTVIAALVDRNSCILLDRHCHNSLVQGAKLSGAKIKRFFHNDLDHLEKLLKETGEKTLIVVESLYSMDGDFANLESLISLAKKYHSKLYVDDAHAVGVFGEGGLGCAANCEGIDVVMGTFGKALGSFGAYLLCSHELKEQLIQKCTGLMYSTALSPAAVGAANAALNVLPHLEKERIHLHHLAKRLAHHTPIVPYITGTEESALKLEEKLAAADILAVAIRPPSVAPNTSRIRISLTAHHTDAHIDKLLEVL